jgi:hypothetical protein
MACQMSDKLVLLSNKCAIYHHKMSIKVNSVDAASCKTPNTQIRLEKVTSAKLFLMMKLIEVESKMILVILDLFCDHLR